MAYRRPRKCLEFGNGKLPGMRLVVPPMDHPRSAEVPSQAVNLGDIFCAGGDGAAVFKSRTGMVPRLRRARRIGAVWC